ncbi:CAP-Gly domain-containing linker protein 1-like [Montipora capricornis]|uniref:CAP-Gly domain-containing linker protein 1-like n=1 Tax=Montipora capricornis TaxID=246305 RepID=UPI0035F10881
MSHDAEHDVRKQVSPYFLSGLQSLESFVQVLEETPNDVSAKAAQRMMPDLLDRVITSHEAFSRAATAIHQINDRLANDFETVVAEEKSTNDSLIQTRQSLVKVEEKVKVLQDERDEVKEQLSKLEVNLRSEEESLRETRERLERAKEYRPKGVALGFVLGGIFGGPVGLLLGGGAAMAVRNADVSIAEKAVDEYSNQVKSTRRRLATKETELGNLIHEQVDQEIAKRCICLELEKLKAKKEDIKKSQERFAKLDYAIKSCTTFVDTTASRAKMLADEASGQLPDIEAMVLPLKAIAGDIAEASLCDTRLLSGRVDMKGIGAKIKVINSKALKSVTSSEIDQWA